jgi:hypothetical protein
MTAATTPIPAPPSTPKSNSKQRPMRVQDPMMSNASIVETQKMLRNKNAESQQNQRNQISIARARENRTGEKRSKPELLEETFDLMNDGRSRSVSQIAKDLGAAWSTIYWLTNMIEFVQSRPRLIREGNMRRKRFYRIAGPRPR